MAEDDPTPKRSDEAAESGVAEALRVAVERTMRATAGSAEATRGRAAELLDDVVRRGRDARDELARRGQEAGIEFARRGQEATGELGRRIELLERRLAELERALGTAAASGGSGAEAEGQHEGAASSKSESEPEG